MKTTQWRHSSSREITLLDMRRVLVLHIVSDSKPEGIQLERNKYMKNIKNIKKNVLKSHGISFNTPKSFTKINLSKYFRLFGSTKSFCVIKTKRKKKRNKLRKTSINKVIIIERGWTNRREQKERCERNDNKTM